jgi:CHAT domain-containing protein
MSELRRCRRDGSIMTATHLLECDFCSLTEAGAPTSRTRSYASHALPAAIVAAVIALLVQPSSRPKSDPMLRLVAAAPLESRSIEPRLGGFPWTPLHANAQRGDVEAPQSRRLLMSAALAEIVQASQHDSSRRARHSAAIAYLLQGDPETAATSLEAVLRTNADPALWSDLAAAHYVAAKGDNNHAQLGRALTAADSALRLNPRLPEAHFNRALILEQLGLREHALEAWNAYLSVDPNSNWANEAVQHVQALQPEPSFQSVLEREYEQLARDPVAAHGFARAHRQDARLWGETNILGRWATAEQEGNRDLAAKHLRVARELGAELARDRGDQMLQALVAAIDRAESAQRKDLAAAHLALQSGQQLYTKHEPARAVAVFRDSAEAFDRGGSPGALLARYFVANTTFSTGNVDESGQQIERLLAQTPPQFMAQRAQLLWQRGIVHVARARWGASIDAYAESAAIFERLGEDRYAAILRDALAKSYDRIGNPVEAWAHRMIALRELGQQSNVRLQTALTNLSLSAVATREYDVARSFFGLAIDISRRLKDPVAQTSTILLRARFHLREGRFDAARADLSEATAVLAQVKDPGYRSLFNAHVSFVEAMLSPSPAKSVELLTKVVEFHRTSGRRGLLPELYLERGRAWYRLHDHLQAASDFEAGVAELETHRETLAKSEDRWGVFYDADDLFREAIALSLEQHQPERAFEYAERARARSLLDVLGERWPTVKPAAISAETVIVEYAVHARGLVIFVVDGDGVRVVEHALDRRTLDADVQSLTDAARKSDRAGLRRSGRAVYRSLIEPVASELAGKKTVVFIPDPRLGSLPFAALVDGAGQFLIESYAIAVAPSASTYTRLLDVRQESPDRHALIVTGAQDLGPLAAAEREADSIAGIYPESVRLTRGTATAAAFARAAVEANVIHFAGHAVSARSGYLLLARTETSDGHLDAKRIASMRLNRTSMVVLAACSTAAGEIRSTEGTISIARAFLAAGVPSVIATLWPIEDEAAAEFFPIVHRHMSRGMPPAEALRAAQLELIREPDTVLWTGVQLIGK